MIKCSSTYNIKKSRFLLHRFLKERLVDHVNAKRGLAIKKVRRKEINNLRKKMQAMSCKIKT
jgi:hypothetical protein